MAVQQRASGIFAKIQGLVDKLVSPSQRRQAYDYTTTFAQEQPILFVSRLDQLAQSTICDEQIANSRSHSSSLNSSCPSGPSRSSHPSHWVL